MTDKEKRNYKARVDSARASGLLPPLLAAPSGPGRPPLRRKQGFRSLRPPGRPPKRKRFPKPAAPRTVRRRSAACPACGRTVQCRRDSHRNTIYRMHRTLGKPNGYESGPLCGMSGERVEAAA